MQVLGRLALLGFLSKDAYAAFREIFNEPGMDNIQAVLCITICPAVPGKASWIAAMRCLKFSDFRFNREAKGLKAEACIWCQNRAFCIIEFDISNIVVIGCPDARVNEVCKDLSSIDSFNDCFV